MGEAAQDTYERDGGFWELIPERKDLHICPICGKIFKKFIGLTAHIDAVHELTE